MPRRDAVIGFGFVLMSAVGLLLFGALRDYGHPTLRTISTAAASPTSTTIGVDPDCQSAPHVDVDIIPDSRTAGANARIVVSTTATRPVTVTQLFLRGPSSPTVASGASVTPPEPATVTAGHSYEWWLMLREPVAGTVLGTYRSPWGVNAVQLTWVAASGAACEGVG